MTKAKLYTFIEVDIFRKRLDKLTTLETLFTIQKDLIENPERGSVISGTNGLRKARVADKRGKRGKSGSFRYLYLFLKDQGVIYLILFFAKNEQESLTQAD